MILNTMYKEVYVYIVYIYKLCLRKFARIMTDKVTVFVLPLPVGTSARTSVHPYSVCPWIGFNSQTLVYPNQMLQNVYTMLNYNHKSQLKIECGWRHFYLSRVLPSWNFRSCYSTYVCLNQTVIKLLHSAYYPITMIKYEIG